MTDEILAQVLATATEVFKQPVSENDSFYDVGGDSLTAIEFSQVLEERLGTEIEIADLIAADNLGAFARGLSASGAPAGS